MCSFFQSVAFSPAAGFINGLFGCGGGILLILTLRGKGICNYRTAPVIMAIAAAVSAGFFLKKEPSICKEATFYLLPAFLGGALGAIWLGKIRLSFLDKLFGILTAFAGILLFLRA